MKRLCLIALGLLALFSAMYVLAEQCGYLDEESARTWLLALGQNRPLGALVVIGLLVVDLALPVPSSVVMLAAGHLLGFALGAAAAFTGSMLAALIGFYACRLGGQAWFRRLSGAEEAGHVARWFRDWGVLAIILSRPIPMLTEILSCLAGLSDLRVRTFVLANILGHLPLSLVYAWAGARSREHAPWVTVWVALIIPALGWLVARRVKSDPREAVDG